MHYSFNNGNIDSLKIPSSRELIEQYMFLYSIAGEDNDFDLILNDTDDPSFTQCFVRIKKVRTVDLMALVDDTEDFIHSNYCMKDSTIIFRNFRIFQVHLQIFVV